MRFVVMFVTAVCVLFLIKLRWPKKKSIYDKFNKFGIHLVKFPEGKFQILGNHPSLDKAH